MHWPIAIERNQAPLLVVVAGLYVMLGLAEGGMIDRVKRSTYRKVLSLLRPAEAAVRRLIIVAARGLVVKPQAARSSGTASSGRSTSDKSKTKSKSQRPLLFRLFDPLRRIGPLIGRPRRRRGPEPRIRVLGPAPIPADIYTGLGTVSFRDAPIGLSPLYSRAVPPPPAEPDDSVSAVSLCRRLSAILDALNNLPRHAERYARWRDKPVEQRRPQREDALRTGPPPYLRRKSKHKVHELLKECHSLAYHALNSEPELKPDTS